MKTAWFVGGPLDRQSAHDTSSYDVSGYKVSESKDVFGVPVHLYSDCDHSQFRLINYSEWKYKEEYGSMAVFLCRILFLRDLGYSAQNHWAFLTAIRQSKDVSPLLVYCDWLEENQYFRAHQFRDPDTLNLAEYLMERRHADKGR